MGIPNLDDGSIERADFDGGNRRVIIPQGVTHTPKQIHLDKPNGKLYWSDREGMRLMSANLDGSHVETVVETGRGDKDRREGGGDLPKGLRAGGLSLTDSWRDAGGVSVRLGLVGGVGDGAGLKQPRITEGLSTGLGGG